MTTIRGNTLRKKNIKLNYPLIAFLIPFLGMLGVMLVGQYEPFGDARSMLYSDMYHQYYPFFVNFRANLLSGDGVLYNWDIGMGLDYLGLISYYLASPLNLLSLLIPESWTLEYFSLLTPLKLGFAGLFFSLFLKKLFDRNDISISLFGGMYGLCAWAVGYHWNVMWLDTFALLPLVALGTIAVLQERKFILYTISLFLAIFANYYIGFFVCIFVLLICIVYEICRFRGFKKLLADVLLMALFSALAIGMTAVLELPALAALKTTQSSVNQFPEKFALNMVESKLFSDYHSTYESYKAALAAGNVEKIFSYGWEAFTIAFRALMDGMRQVAGNMGGGIVPTFKEGLPNLYCGVTTMVLATLFLLSKETCLRDKICSVLLLVFLSLSFILRQLDYIWHGFHFTNMIPYRFSFLFSFVMLYMGYKAWTQRQQFKLWQILIAGVAPLLIFTFANTNSDIVYLAYNLVFLTLSMAALMLPQLQKALPEDADEEEQQAHQRLTHFNKQVSSVALCVIFGLEILFNVINFGVNFPYTGVSNYPKGLEDSADAIAYMQSHDDELFYRTEVTHSQTLNDGALNGYHGISTFTSSANVKVTEFMKDLGYGAKNTYNRYCFEESSPVSNLFLGLKYMVERDGNVESNMFFNTVQSFGKVYLLENKAYLPLGFLANSSLGTVDFETSSDAFLFQNRLIKLASGIEGDVWTKLTGDVLQVGASGVTLQSSGNSGYASYHGGANGGTVSFTFTADRDGFACLNLSNLSKKNSYSVMLNGQTLFSETYSLPQMIAVSDVVVGDTITVNFTCKAGENGSINAMVAVLDPQLFWQAYDVLAASTLELTTFESTLVEGTVDCNRNGLLYTSIPQNGNWHAYVDGKEVEITLIGDAMIAVPLTEGSHTVTFRYRNIAFEQGLAISLGCLALFISLAIPIYRARNKKGKYQK